MNLGLRTKQEGEPGANMQMSLASLRGLHTLLTPYSEAKREADDGGSLCVIDMGPVGEKKADY